MGFINGIPTDSDGGLDTKFRMTDNTDPNGGAFSGNNEYKGGCECTFSYNLN